MNVAVAALALSAALVGCHTAPPVIERLMVSVAGPRWSDE